VISRNARFVLVVVLLAGTALLLHARSDGSFVPQRFPLASFPIGLSSWVGTDIPIPDEILKKLGPGEFLQRTYQTRTKEDQAGGQSNVDLYIAYLPNQTVLYRHLPQECLAGAGWSPVESGITNLAFSGDAPFPVNRYVIAKGSERQLVLFWYSAHGRRVASEDSMEWHLMFDSLRSNRSDNALIRLNTELKPGEQPAEAEQRLLSFASLVNSLLKNYIPR
jgi:EpsI family protein